MTRKKQYRPGGIAWHVYFITPVSIVLGFVIGKVLFG